MSLSNRKLKAFLSIFRKKKIKYLGRTGIHFAHEGSIYFIDSELLATQDADVVINTGNVFLVLDDKMIALDKDKSAIILQELKFEFGKIGIIAIFPEQVV